MKKRTTWQVRAALTKKREQTKKRAVAHAASAIEGLWALAADPDSAFTAKEREAIADASYCLRGIVGGWINDRRGR